MSFRANRYNRRMQLYIPAITIKAALAGFEAIDYPAAELLDAIGISPEALEDPFASVPNRVFAQIWIEAFQRENDPTLPSRAGLGVPFNEFGMLDHLVKTADTLGEGLHMLNLFFWLVSVNMGLEFDHGPDDWVWVVNDPPEPSAAISEQWSLAVIVNRMRENMPGFGIGEVWLKQPAGPAAEAFEAVWGVPVRLGMQRTGVRLNRGVWGIKNPGADPTLRQTLRSVAEQIELKQVDDAPLVYAIRTRLPEALQDGAFRAEDIAAELGLSKRTLQRKLSAENVTFKQLLDLYRQEQALQMLQNGQRSMTHIAYALGYSEQSSFNRAFKRWTGRSPSDWLAPVSG